MNRFTAGLTLLLSTVCLQTCLCWRVVTYRVHLVKAKWTRLVELDTTGSDWTTNPQGHQPPHQLGCFLVIWTGAVYTVRYASNYHLTVFVTHRLFCPKTVKKKKWKISSFPGLQRHVLIWPCLFVWTPVLTSRDVFFVCFFCHQVQKSHKLKKLDPENVFVCSAEPLC